MRNVEYNVSSNHKSLRQALFILLFLVVLIGSLVYVKWYPYWQKALGASATHSIGTAIIADIGAKASGPSLQAGWQFTVAYFTSVWKAVILGLLVGSLVQVLIPTSWIKRYLGGSQFKDSFVATLMSVPTMMCTCCSAPVAVGMKRSQASSNSVVAFFLANPLLNPATLVFMGFVLGWNFTIFRIIFGLVTVLGIASLVAKFGAPKNVTVPNNKMFDPIDESNEILLVRWLKALVRLIVESIPAYVVIVYILGTFQGVLFPAIHNGLNGGLMVILLFAVVGTLFVIPTAGEIPIIQALMALGLTTGPAAALLITLPAVSIVSLTLLKPVFSWKNLAIIGGGVLVMGIVAGVVGSFIL